MQDSLFYLYRRLKNNDFFIVTYNNRAIGQKVLIKIAIHIDNSMSVAI